MTVSKFNFGGFGEDLFLSDYEGCGGGIQDNVSINDTGLGFTYNGVGNRNMSLSHQSNGRFNGTYTQPTYGNESTISGRIKHKHVAGTVQINYHYPPDPAHGYPEENCDAGKLVFKAELDAPDETVPPTPRVR